MMEQAVLEVAEHFKYMPQENIAKVLDFIRDINQIAPLDDIEDDIPLRDKGLRGALAKYASPDLIKLESTALEEAIVENYKKKHNID